MDKKATQRTMEDRTMEGNECSFQDTLVKANGRILATLFNDARTLLAPAGFELRIDGRKVDDVDTQLRASTDHVTQFHVHARFETIDGTAECSLTVQTRPEFDDKDAGRAYATDPEGNVWQRFSLHANVVWPSTLGQSDDGKVLRKRIELYTLVVDLLEALQNAYGNGRSYWTLVTSVEQVKKTHANRQGLLLEKAVRSHMKGLRVDGAPAKFGTPPREDLSELDLGDHVVSIDVGSAKHRVRRTFNVTVVTHVNQDDFAKHVSVVRTS